MSVEITVATTSDEHLWNDYVSRHPRATPYHRFGWLQAVQTAYKHPSCSLIAKDNNATIVGLLPAVLMSVPLKGKSLCSLPYCDSGFAIADNDEIKQALYDYQANLITTQKARHSEIRDISSSTELSNERLSGKKVRMVLPLPESSELLLASFKSKLRSQIRKAEKNGLTFQVGRSAELLEHFYRVYSINMRDLGSPVHHINWFKAIIDYYQDNAIMSVVYHEDIPIGAGLVLCNNHKAAIPWASTVQDYNRLAPNMLLYWSLLSYCADNQITSFDFGRSTFNEGTYKFKKQWGAEPELLHWFSIPEQDSAAENTDSGSKLRPLVENIWRKLPLGLTIKVGASVRGYISL